jgi:hypothetical protein
MADDGLRLCASRSSGSKPLFARGAVLAAVPAEPGDRSWGQVGGFSGGLKAHQGRGAAGSESRAVAGKSWKQALLVCLPPAARNLHGKEGVDGSSPSEGSAKAPQGGASSFGWSCTIFSVRWVWSLDGAFRLRSGCPITRISAGIGGEPRAASSLDLEEPLARLLQIVAEVSELRPGPRLSCRTCCSAARKASPH